jgi:hypothetical protein
VADFIHRRVTNIMQQPTRIVCPICAWSWPISTTTKVLEEHVRLAQDLAHRELWYSWTGYVADIRELNEMFALRDERDQ